METYFCRMNRHELKTVDFVYELPEERIAKYPLKNRNDSKLLVYKNSTIKEVVFKKLEKELPRDSMLVFNDTKVLSARLRFQKETGARIEIFCLEPHESTVEQALTANSKCTWQCMVGNLKRFKQDDTLILELPSAKLFAKMIERREQDVIVEFSWEGGVEFSEVLEKAGEIPLPPYLNRQTEKGDSETYQTVYAKEQGAVAAPTAGLHFIEEQLEDLQAKGHKLNYLTLFVGAGTFRSMKAEKLVEHEMHRERILVSRDALQSLYEHSGKLISVGTTSLRSLESLYWLAVKIHKGSSMQALHLGQEDAYMLPELFSWKEACAYLLEYLSKTGEQNLDFHSSLYVMPGYKWKAIDGLVTNFHQPQSSLLALVAAWIGEDWKKVYHYALEHDFRFLSYGDSSLLMRS